MRLYDNAASANCLKCRVLLRQLELPFEPVEVDLFRGDARRPPHLERNPDGRVPVLETDAGELIPESGAILLYLAEGTPLLPAGRLERARVHQWMFFEQNHIEAELASARFMALTGRAEREPEVFAAKVAAGRRSLESSHAGSPTAGRSCVGTPTRSPTSPCTPTSTARATRARTRPSTPGIEPWLRRVEATPRFVNDLAPIPPARDAAAGLTRRVSRVTGRRTHSGGDGQTRRVESITHRGGAMPEVPSGVTDDSIQVRQVNHYQFTWVAGESGAPARGRCSSCSTRARGRRSSPSTPTTPTMLQDLLSTAGTVYYDVARQTLMFGTTAVGSA